MNADVCLSKAHRSMYKMTHPGRKLTLIWWQILKWSFKVIMYRYVSLDALWRGEHNGTHIFSPPPQGKNLDLENCFRKKQSFFAWWLLQLKTLTLVQIWCPRFLDGVMGYLLLFRIFSVSICKDILSGIALLVSSIFLLIMLIIGKIEPFLACGDLNFDKKCHEYSVDVV